MLLGRKSSKTSFRVTWLITGLVQSFLVYKNTSERNLMTKIWKLVCQHMSHIMRKRIFGGFRLLAFRFCGFTLCRLNCLYSLHIWCLGRLYRFLIIAFLSTFQDYIVSFLKYRAISVYSQADDLSSMLLSSRLNLQIANT